MIITEDACLYYMALGKDLNFFVGTLIHNGSIIRICPKQLRDGTDEILFIA